MRRVDLLHTHGSPTAYLYQNRNGGCRCAACRGQRADRNAAFHAAHPTYNRDYRAAHRDERRAYGAAYDAAHLEEKSAYQRRRKYNLLPGEWDAMFAAQGNRCAVCGTDDPGSKWGWHTDHDHGAGVVRGILCHGCNVGLGGFRDDPERLVAAIEYLEAKS